MTDVLEVVERYLDAAPRVSAQAEEIGPFTLFVRSPGGYPYYARPSLGAGPIVARDVRVVRARQRALGVPETFEWTVDLHPDLAVTLASTHLAVVTHPLLVLDAIQRPGHIPGMEIWRVDPQDDLAPLIAISDLAFGNPGTGVGPVGSDDVAIAAAGIPSETVIRRRERLAAGAEFMLLATMDGVPAAVGTHTPVDGASEIVGVGTLPAFRRRGIAAALTVALANDARERGCDTVFLSAGDPIIARVYERVGFRMIGSAGAAEPAPVP